MVDLRHDLDRAVQQAQQQANLTGEAWGVVACSTLDSSLGPEGVMTISPTKPRLIQIPISKPLPPDVLPLVYVGPDLAERELPVTKLEAGEAWIDGAWCLKCRDGEECYHLSLGHLITTVTVYPNVIRNPKGTINWDPVVEDVHWPVNTPLQQMLREMHTKLVAQAQLSLDQMGRGLAKMAEEIR